MSIIFRTADERIVVIDLQTAKLSNLIKNMLDSLGEEYLNLQTIPMPTITGEVFFQVFQWAMYHKSELLREPNKDFSESISAWDAEFLEGNTEILLPLSKAAIYLEIHGLFQLACKGMANKIKSYKTDDDLRNGLNIPCKPGASNISLHPIIIERVLNGEVIIRDPKGKLENETKSCGLRIVDQEALEKYHEEQLNRLKKPVIDPEEDLSSSSSDNDSDADANAGAREKSTNEVIEIQDEGMEVDE